MERFGSMLMRTWNNNDKKNTLNNNNNDYDHDDDLSSWEIININPKPNNIINTPHDDHDDDDHHHVLLQQQQQHGLSLSNKYDIDRHRSDDNDHSLAIGSQYDHTTNMVSDELEPFQNILNATGPSSSSAAFLITHPFPIDAICDPVCNQKLDHEEKEEKQVHKSINYDDVEDDDGEEYDDYDYDDDSRWLRKQRMTKVGKKVNNGMMKKSNKLPRYFYNKFV